MEKEQIYQSDENSSGNRHSDGGHSSHHHSDGGHSSHHHSDGGHSSHHHSDGSHGSHHHSSGGHSSHHHSGNGHHRHRESGSIWKRVLVVLAVLLFVLVVLAAAVYMYFRYNFYGRSNYVKDGSYTIAETIEPETYVDENGVTQQVSEAKLDEEKEKDMVSHHTRILESLSDLIRKDTGTYNLLLIGVDRREASWNGNSDVMMLVTVNNDRDTIYMTSFLRDLYANIPGVGVRKLNASCAYGGAPLCVETIRSNYGVEIDNYAMVDFNAMIDIVDVLGGVDLELTESEASVANDYVRTMCEENGEPYEYHQILGSGMQHLDGYQAVAYARNRYSGNDYDFGRTERQRKVLMAIVDKARSGGLGSLSSAAQAVLPHVTHDIDEGTVLKLLTKIPGWLNYDIEEQHIPYDNMYYSENEILIPDMEATITKLRETIY